MQLIAVLDGKPNVAVIIVCTHENMDFGGVGMWLHSHLT